eukprot:11298760-Karenia_brevis.AAC.1
MASPELFDATTCKSEHIMSNRSSRGPLSGVAVSVSVWPTPASPGPDPGRGPASALLVQVGPSPFPATVPG